MIWIADAHRDDGKRFVAVASANRSTACCKARMAARRRSHFSVPFIERNRALGVRSTRACHPGPRVTKGPPQKGLDTHFSEPVLRLPTPSATGQVEWPATAY